MPEAQHPKHALPLGYRLQEYELVRMLGSGGFGITYLGHFKNSAVAIKEYFPLDFATRTGDHSVVPRASNSRDTFEWGLDRFSGEAETLARFDHRHIVKVFRFFEAHGTAYIVMEYIKGETLSAYLKRKGTLTESELKEILFPLLDGLKVVHGAKFLHRDIKPANIIIRAEDGSPVLIDFGAARQAIGARSRPLSAIGSPGYSPYEQYLTHGNQGPWTDLYALGAVCYRALTGAVPNPSSERNLRNHPDPLVPIAKRCKDQASRGFLLAIDHALQVEEEDRPQTIGAWRAEIEEERRKAAGSTALSIYRRPKKEKERRRREEEERQKEIERQKAEARKARGKRVRIALGALVVLVVAYLGGDWVIGEIDRRQAEIKRQVEAHVSQFEAALSGGNLSSASDYVSRIRALDSDASVLGKLERRLADALPAELARQRSIAPGRTFKDCSECPQMVEVPSGWFEMGSPSSEEGREKNEWPQHRVEIGYRLAVGVYEVTFAEWDACVASGGCNGYRPSDRGRGRGRRPVINVSWDDAQAYVSWLSSKTGHSYHLLSESEWEYVARAGTRTAFHFGKTISTSQANYDGNYTYSSGRKGVYRDKTVPVGSFSSNAFGLYDIHGNVWEWTQDCWNESYSGAPRDGSAWVRDDCSKRVLRGGSWFNEPWKLRSADRGWNSTDLRSNVVGFRVARRSFKDCAECPVMVEVPTGSFMMGSPSDEKDRNDNEGPQHRVELEYRLAVGVYEVTFAEWDACVASGWCNGYRPNDAGWGRGRRPVINVSWEDAQAYVRWLSNKTGHSYRLLSESEWEYVARAGTTTPFHFGETISTSQANYDGNYTYSSGRKGVYRREPVPVGSFPSNAFGLYDVHGNVQEWVEDCGTNSYSGVPRDGSEWVSDDCIFRVLRGGSWSVRPRYLRSADRSWTFPESRNNGLGFRVARRF